MSNLPAYRKSIAAIVGAVITWGLTAQAEGIEGVEWWGLAAAIGTALGVFGVTNETPVDERGAVEPGSFALGLILGVLALLAIAVLSESWNP